MRLVGELVAKLHQGRHVGGKRSSLLVQVASILSFFALTCDLSRKRAGTQGDVAAQEGREDCPVAIVGHIDQVQFFGLGDGASSSSIERRLPLCPYLHSRVFPGILHELLQGVIRRVFPRCNHVQKEMDAADRNESLLVYGAP